MIVEWKHDKEHTKDLANMGPGTCYEDEDGCLCIVCKLYSTVEEGTQIVHVNLSDNEVYTVNYLKEVECFTKGTERECVCTVQS